MLKKLAIFLFGFLVFAYIIGRMEAAARPQDVQAASKKRTLQNVWCAKMEGPLQTVLASGVVKRHSPDWKTVYVDRSWYGIEVDNKEAFLKVVGNCRSEFSSLTVKDAYSNQVVGTYGPLGGAKVLG